MEIRQWFVDHRSGVLVQCWLMVVSVFTFIVFVDGVCNILRSETRGRIYATVAGIGGAVVATTLLVGQATFNAVVWIDGTAEASPDSTVRLVWSIACLMIYGATMPGIVLLTGAVATAGLRGSVVPLWLGRVAAVVAAVAVCGTLIQFGPGFAWFGLAAFLGLAVFGMTAAVSLLASDHGAVDTAV
jgi:hypothetical protein